MTTYPAPKDGWVCFHCGERFIKYGEALDHFGAHPGITPACIVKGSADMGLLIELRKTQALNAALHRALKKEQEKNQ